MKNVVSFWDVADRDVNEAADYLGRESVPLGRRFYTAVQETCKALAEFPNLGREREVFSPHLLGLRSHAVQGFENYLIFYRPVADGVEIIRVLHGARDVDRILEE